mmetsp:Transcript_65972/g.136604  ORF Transcript_65972/g.136604 Transcript_65972/m.136604 type:complete len:257 (-) Transcript_65972:214-984(-)
MAEDIPGISGFDLEAFLAAQKRTSEDAKREARDPLGRHRWVCLQNLQTAALNGKYAEIVVPANADGRFGVRVQGEPVPKLIKKENLKPIDDAETVQVCRLAAKGESQFIGGYIQNTRWPRAILSSMPGTVSPISVKLGFPLHVTRVQARSKLSDRAEFDNQWATYMLIDPRSGFAPDEWQSFVGPVVVWRPEGDVSSDDVSLLNDFVSDLLNGPYCEGTLEPDRDLTPAAWARHRERTLENLRLNPRMEQYEDLHI